MKTTEKLLPNERSRIAQAVSLRFRTQKDQALDSSIITRSPEELSKTSYTLVLGGCQYPASLFDVEPGYEAYARLAKMLKNRELTAEGLVLTGDQIYADATAGLFDPVQLVDHYRRSYERLLQKTPVREVMRQIPVIPMLDDHEIFDNYEPINSHFNPDSSKVRQTRLQRAARHYIEYQRGSGPYPDGKVEEINPDKLWYDLKRSGLPIFVCNTRTERQHRDAGRQYEAKIMGNTQMEALKHWLLRQDASLPKIVVSPSIFLPRHTRIVEGIYPLLSDSWDGYPSSLNDLLGFIATNSIQNVVFVSGDEHLGCACKAEINPLESGQSNGKTVSIHSIHTSALYAPYPFANASESDLIKRDVFNFSYHELNKSEKQFQCTYDTNFYSGFGFTIMKILKEPNGKWALNCTFDRDIKSAIYSSKLS